MGDSVPHITRCSRTRLTDKCGHSKIPTHEELRGAPMRTLSRIPVLLLLIGGLDGCQDDRVNRLEQRVATLEADIKKLDGGD